MALRTPQIFAALSNPLRLRVLLAILREEDYDLRRKGRTQAQALVELTGMKQPAISQACRELLTVGLLERPGSIREAFRVAYPREARALIRAAALIESLGSGGAEAAELAREMLRDDMARGAAEEQVVPSRTAVAEGATATNRT